ncbi:MAG TPA: glycosyltransferase [Candidatus Binatia bacterium]|nr:glycosyltransferase [Candidatus Binatia bacterium]
MLRVADFLEDQQVFRSPDAPARPAVSVVLPTYRRCASGQLQRAIESVLAQTFDDLELLVVDDGSTDGSADLIDRARAKDGRVVHVRHDRNCGLPGLRVNEGIELARGCCVAFQFDDDTWRPAALARLTGALARLDRPGLAIGTARFVGPSGQWVLPPRGLNLVALYEQNRLANNCVLLPREVLDRFGWYDPHIAMRRLCDWDLWLRIVKHVPFVVDDEVIADVHESNPDSIGSIVPWDLSLFRYLHDIPRDRLLGPTTWRSYQVDALTIGDVALARDFRRRAWTRHIVPYYLRFRAAFPQIEGFRPSVPVEAKTVLYTKNAYDVSNDVTLNNFDALASRRGSYKSHFQPLEQVTADWPAEADALLLVRVVEERGKELAAQARVGGRPLGAYLDDDLLTFHEFGPEFAYLAPGTPYAENLAEMLRASDAVWVTNESIGRSVAPVNPRIVPHTNSVPLEAVAADPAPRDPRRARRIAYAGSGYRREEFSVIWEALREISRAYGDRVSFEFWGLDVAAFPPLDSPVRHVPFTFSYFEYLTRLREAEIDVLLCPLLDHPTPRLGKSLIKYFEAAAAGAVGVFSDVAPYRALPAGLTCLKVANEAGPWRQALETLIDMPATAFEALRRRCVRHVREEYSNAALVDRHEAAWRATEFHALSRAQRHPDGRPRVAYFLHSAIFGGGELQLWRRLRLARAYGIEPVVVLPSATRGSRDAERIAADLAVEGTPLEFAEYTCLDVPRTPAGFASDRERDDVRALLRASQPALVHSVTFIPSVGQVCRELGIPHVASMYQVEVEDAAGPPEYAGTHCTVNQSDSLKYTERWSELLGTPGFCAREVAPADIFRLGFERSTRPPAPRRAGPLRLVMTGTLQPRKQQAVAIEAVGRLRRDGLDCRLDLYGYTGFFTDYAEECRDLITHWALQDHVAFHGFASDMRDVLDAADVLLSVSISESFPSALKEAMAAGLLVVATPIGGISELVVDGETGILCRGVGVDAVADGIGRAARLDASASRRVVEAARRVARAELHPDRAANDLMAMYVMALEHGRREAGAVAPSAVLPVPAPRARVRQEVVGSPPLDYVSLVRPRAYRLVPRLDALGGVAVLMGSPIEAPVEAHLVFELVLPSGRVVRRGEVELAVRGAAGRWVELAFDPIEHSAGQLFVLRLRLDGAPGPDVGLFETHHERSLGERAALRWGLEGVRTFTHARLLYRP